MKQIDNNTAELGYVKGKLDMLDKNVEDLDDKVDKLGDKVDKLADSLSMTRAVVMGAKWLLAGVAGMLGMNADVVLRLIERLL